ncbi:hypothetical protein HOI26_04755 [Candidatus Woesearchaeota archaeon]|nr:hypothetical protein [Candidatus Woesearchaeota archaeon]MBT5740380.1 hypothetical protein [Candidatus Woesearchaeota archaeon]
MKRLRYSPIFRHIVVAFFTGALTFLFYFLRQNLAAGHRIWRATGDVGFTLLFVVLFIGPLSKIWRKTSFLYLWRRQFGIWFALMALLHTVLIFSGWFKWNLLTFIGFQYVPEVGKELLIFPGFGLANLIGLVALFLTLILLATSSDKALHFFGVKSWKYIHLLAHIIFYLVSFHAIYFLFLHFNQAIYQNLQWNNWAQYYIVALLFLLILFQCWSFIKIVKTRRKVK